MLQLALSLMEDAPPCLLLLSPERQSNYGALVSLLQRHFGKLNLLDALCSEFGYCAWLLGEFLCNLAYDKSLGWQAYTFMSPAIQDELVKDQFVQALVPLTSSDWTSSWPTPEPWVKPWSLQGDHCLCTEVGLQVLVTAWSTSQELLRKRQPARSLPRHYYHEEVGEQLNDSETSAPHSWATLHAIA